MEQTAERIESVYEFLLRKGISKVHQPFKRYNLTVAELVEFLNEFAEISAQEEFGKTGYINEPVNFQYSVQ